MMTDRDKRTIDVEHVGGPYDGETVPVDVDADGQPPEFYMTKAVGPMDYSIDPMYGAQSKIVNWFYRLDARVDAAGIRWVYIYEAETVTDAAA